MVDGKTQYDGKKLDELTACVFEHYIKHNDVVLRKIKHARTATNRRFQDYANVQLHLEDSGELQEMKKYDELWQTIIELFRGAGLSEAGLQKIEKVLSNIPGYIKKYYDVLISRDKPLLRLMKELASEKYQEAFKAIKEINMSRNLSTADTKPSNNLPGSASPEYILRRINTIT